MEKIPDKSIDLILCDLPYGTTSCPWDVVIPFEPMWAQYERIIKDRSAIVLFGSEPFSSNLRNSNMSLYKYDWKWIKNTATGFVNVKSMPLKDYEDIMVFSRGKISHNEEARIKYNPQNLKYKATAKAKNCKAGIYGKIQAHSVNDACENYPKMCLYFKSSVGGIHPTQKPVPLCSYLIKTYSNKGDIVLDNCMGSGTTAIACIKTGRNYIGFEMDNKYYKAAIKRIHNEMSQVRFDLEEAI